MGVLERWSSPRTTWVIAGVEVVDGDREVVERRAVGAGDHRIVDAGVGEPGLAADHVVDDRLAVVGHAQAHRAGLLGLAAEAAIGAVALLVGLDVVGGRGRVVGVAVGEQLLERLAVALRALGLEDRPLVPVELQPAQRIEDLLDVLRRRALAVGIFDPQHERAILALGQQPVVQRRAGAADVERPGRGWSKANAHGDVLSSMLIGAHVSPAGGLPKAVERGAERGCEAIQIFNQSPRMWRPTAYGEDDFAEFREAIEPSPIKAVLIHAVYLLNCASEDREIRDKSRASLIQSLRVGDGIGAAGVVLHPGLGQAGRRRQGDQAGRQGDRGGARRDRALPAAPRGHRRRRRHARTLVRGAGALIDAAGGGERLGVCLDSCHLLASGYDIRTATALSDTLDGLRPRSWGASACARCTSTTR